PTSTSSPPASTESETEARSSTPSSSANSLDDVDKATTRSSGLPIGSAKCSPLSPTSTRSNPEGTGPPLRRSSVRFRQEGGHVRSHMNGRVHGSDGARTELLDRLPL